MEIVCQPSYPRNSENASPFGTRTVYLAWPVSCAEMVLPPRTASTETASETTTITTTGILFRFIATLLGCCGRPASGTSPVQFGHRQQMQGQMLRQSRFLQLPFPILGGNVSVSDLAVQRVGELPGDPLHVLRPRTGELVYT